MDQVRVDGILHERQAYSTIVQCLAFIKNDNCPLEEEDSEGNPAGYCHCWTTLKIQDTYYSNEQKEFGVEFDPDFAAKAPHP